MYTHHHTHKHTHTTASIPIDIGHDMNGALDQNETVRYNLQIPVIGVTVVVCASAGHIVLYGSSTTPDPNSAFYEFFLQVVYANDTEQCDRMFYKPDTPSTSPLEKRNEGVPQSETMTLYLSVVGKDKENSFVHLNSTAGDTCPGDIDPSKTNNIVMGECCVVYKHKIYTAITSLADNNVRVEVHIALPNIFKLWCPLYLFTYRSNKVDTYYCWQLWSLCPRKHRHRGCCMWLCCPPL